MSERDYNQEPTQGFSSGDERFFIDVQRKMDQPLLKEPRPLLDSLRQKFLDALPIVLVFAGGGIIGFGMHDLIPVKSSLGLEYLLVGSGLFGLSIILSRTRKVIK